MKACCWPLGDFLTLLRVRGRDPAITITTADSPTEGFTVPLDKELQAVGLSSLMDITKDPKQGRREEP